MRALATGLATPAELRVAVEHRSARVRRLVERASAIRVPTLILSAGAELVVRLSTQRKFFARLGSERKEHIVYPDFYHHVFHEQDRHLPIGRAGAFLEDLFAGGSRS